MKYLYHYNCDFTTGEGHYKEINTSFGTIRSDFKIKTNKDMELFLKYLTDVFASYGHREVTIQQLKSLTLLHTEDDRDRRIYKKRR